MPMRPALPVRPEALRPATAKAAADRAAAAARSGWPEDPGQLRKSTKRSAELVCVADIPPVPRTAEDSWTRLSLFDTDVPALKNAAEPTRFRF